jgi:hypothetical protein
VENKMAEFVGGVETGPRSVILVRAQDDYGTIGEGQRERIDVGGVERHADHDDTVVLEEPDHILDWASGDSPLLPRLVGGSLDLLAVRVERQFNTCWQRDWGKFACLVEIGEVVGELGERPGTAAMDD